jgi:hypothetical protein
MVHEEDRTFRGWIDAMPGPPDLYGPTRVRNPAAVSGMRVQITRVNPFIWNGGGGMCYRGSCVEVLPEDIKSVLIADDDPTAQVDEEEDRVEAGI